MGSSRREVDVNADPTMGDLLRQGALSNYKKDCDSLAGGLSRHDGYSGLQR